MLSLRYGQDTQSAVGVGCALLQAISRERCNHPCTPRVQVSSSKHPPLVNPTTVWALHFTPIFVIEEK